MSRNDPYRKKTKKEEELDLDFLPETGLNTPDGYLFYHANILNLTKDQYERTEAHGINLRSNKNFSIEETVTIFQNWRKYAMDNGLEVKKALKYMMTSKKEDSHFVWHRYVNNFWPKLCDGLPHRSGHSIRERAKNVLTDSILETLDWEQLEEQVREKYYTPETYDDEKLKEWRKVLTDKHKPTHVARVMGITATKAVAVLAKLKRSEERDDPTMIHKCYEAATSSGLNADKIREHVVNNNKTELDNLRQNVKIKELSYHLRISNSRCIELLKIVLKTILDKFRESKKGGATDDVAWSDAMREMSKKPELEKSQIYKAAEIFCQNATNEDTTTTLARSTEIGELLDQKLFNNLIRHFRLKEKLHFLLWGYKRREVWNMLPVGKDQNRYEAVLEFELANPLVSKTTRKFLKYGKVAEWIMEDRSSKHRHEAIFESFILYTHKKYSGEFKFPVKLNHLFSKKTSNVIQSILEETTDPENYEYVSLKRAKTHVEEASGKKICVEIRNKNIMMKQADAENSDDEIISI
ncbi:hypothetical protein GCK72_008228 [Caenorhabditis remanei]|uniref:Uncharacterized protein n=1 Tax=Caenorhabditis remanei TaxID=31234 RepID=A0A6A5H007_CAERE|nr:hypothetical protein GCK72_008228 [Caenorhabditis remanei]KAF1759983.1 hypothetical protein GCK72_008228 [Caenorhabditis remanei]